MNKTISINIAGFAFIVEEQAFKKLQEYLAAIRRNFMDEAEREEIMGDIESRIAEIFKEKLDGVSREVILMVDVDEVMTIMGMPEDYVTEETIINDEPAADYEEAKREKASKKLYRDSENTMIGGVCSGLGYYFNIDPTLVRVLFVLFGFFGGGVLLYLILLIVLPEAKTTSQKLHMKGQSVNIDSIKDHVSNVKSSVKNGARNAENNIKRGVDKVVGAGKNFMGTFSKLIGIVFLVWGIGALFFILMFFFFGAGVLPVVQDGENVGITTIIGLIYPGEGSYGLLIAAMFCVVVLPVIGIIISGVKMLFRYTKTSRPLTISLLILWLLAAGYVGAKSINLGMNFSNRAEVKQDIEMLNDSADVLYIDVVDDEIFAENIELHNVWNFSELISLDQEKLTMGLPEIRIVPVADSGSFEIQLNKESCGISVKDAVAKAGNIDYNVELKGNKLSLPPYFTIPKVDKIRAQYPTLIVRVPAGKRIVFGAGIDRINVSMSENKYCSCSYDYAFSEWEGNGETLTCIDCKEE